MSDDSLPPLKPPPAHAEQHVRDGAARAFAHHAKAAAEPLGRVRSLWWRKVEVWVLWLASLVFVGWAVAKIVLSR